MLGVVVGEYGSEMVGGGGGGSGVSRGEGGVGGSVGHVRGLGGTIGRPVRHAVVPFGMREVWSDMVKLGCVLTGMFPCVD